MNTSPQLLPQSIEMQPPKKRLSFIDDFSLSGEEKGNRQLAKIEEFPEANEEAIEPNNPIEGNLLRPEEVVAQEELAEEGIEGEDDDSEAGLNNSLEVPFEDDMINIEEIDDADYIMEYLQVIDLALKGFLMVL